MLAMMIAQLGGSVIGALGAPEGQELQSFEGEGAQDPRQALSDARGGITEMIDLLKRRANQPIQLRGAYAQQPPVFAGGGMPMPIGVTGQDPALFDPSLLSLPGVPMPTGNPSMSFPRTHAGGGVDSNDGYIPHDDAIFDPDRTAVPRNETNPGMPRRRSPAAASASTAGATNVSTYDDLPQGAGAVELLLRSMAGMG